MTAQTTPAESIKNLSLLSLFISPHVRSAMEAALITTAADAFFHQHPDRVQDRFRTNPANTLPYSALAALEERSIVAVAETLNDGHDLYPVTATIRRKEDIFLHRNALSHPATVKWRKKMIPFIEAKRDAYDLRPALLWDLHRSINDELRASGEKPTFEALVGTTEMGIMLRSILDLARGPGLELWPVDAYTMYLADAAPKYVAGLEKHPDGKIEVPSEVRLRPFEIAKLYGEYVCVLEPGASASLVRRASGERRFVQTHFLCTIGVHAATEEEGASLLGTPEKIDAMAHALEGAC